MDPLVRSDCVRELGQWMIAYQDHFVASSYLKYLGFVLSDKSAAVRLEALKVLAKLYEIENQPTALRQFTTRFTDRFVEMAIGESDTLARLGAIKVATLVHRHGQLEEEDQVKLSALIFGANAKVRKGMAKFVKARVWEDEVEGRMAAGEIVISSSKDSTELKKDWIELKSLVNFLIKVGKTVEEQNEIIGRNDKQADKTGTRLFEETKVGRIALAIEALWSEIESLKVYKLILCSMGVLQICLLIYRWYSHIYHCFALSLELAIYRQLSYGRSLHCPGRLFQVTERQPRSQVVG